MYVKKIFLAAAVTVLLAISPAQAIPAADKPELTVKSTILNRPGKHVDIVVLEASHNGVVRCSLLEGLKVIAVEDWYVDSRIFTIPVRVSEAKADRVECYYLR